MRRKKKGRNTVVVIILICLIIIVVNLTVILICLVLKKNSSQVYMQNTSTENVSYQNQSVYDDRVIDIRQELEKNFYQITYQQEKRYSGSSMEHIADSYYDVYYDLDGDNIQEKIALKFEYSTEEETLDIKLIDKTQIMAECMLEKKLTSGSTVEVVGITNKSGVGIGVISRSFDYSADKFVLQFVVWEYDNNQFSEQWNVIYTGVAASNGFMRDGYIYGKIRDDNINYATETHMNGYILNRSTLMSDMKNLGIYLPKDTIRDCLIKYNHYVTGLMYFEVE